MRLNIIEHDSAAQSQRKGWAHWLVTRSCNRESDTRYGITRIWRRRYTHFNRNYSPTRSLPGPTSSTRRMKNLHYTKLGTKAGRNCRTMTKMPEMQNSNRVQSSRRSWERYSQKTIQCCHSTSTMLVQRHPSHSQTSRLLTSSLSLGAPVPRATQYMRGV